MTLEDHYNRFFERLQNNEVGVDLADGAVDVKVALLDDQHSPDLGDDATWDDISSDEITNTSANDDGYSAGGETLSNKSINVDTTERTVDFDADDVNWTDSTIDARYAVVYNADPSSDSDKDLIMLIDFEEEKSSENADFTIEWNADGLHRIDSDPA